jgi:molecular chaperone GrpE
MARVRVPVRTASPDVSEYVPPVVDVEAPPPNREPNLAGSSPPASPGKPHPAMEEEREEEEGVQVWRDRALRYQAEMDNYRKRQQRLADERVAADRERLLRAFLQVGDDLERALKADGADADNLREGIALTRQTLARLLESEGVEPIEAEAQPFDPTYHEAVGTVPTGGNGPSPAEQDTVVKVVEEGYRLGDHLLRPARVIVAT